MMHQFAIEEQHLYDIASHIRHIDRIDFDKIYFPTQSSVVVDLFIKLNDLLLYANKIGRRINFDDDLEKTGDIKDITDAINYVRGDVSHMTSPNKLDKARKIALQNIWIGPGCMENIIGKPPAFNNEKDDFLFVNGSVKLYLNLHILRAYKEVRNVFKQLIDSYNQQSGIRKIEI